MSSSSVYKKCEDCGTVRNEEDLQYVTCCEYQVCLDTCIKLVCKNDIGCFVYCKNCKNANSISRERYTKNIWLFEFDYNKYGGYDAYNGIDLEEAYKIMYPSPGKSYYTCDYCYQRNILHEKWNVEH